MGRAKTEVTGKIEDAKGKVNEVIGKAAEKVLEQVAEVDPATKQEPHHLTACPPIMNFSWK